MLTSLGAKVCAEHNRQLLQVPLQLRGFVPCLRRRLFLRDTQWRVTLVRCPVDERCVLEVEYSWHVPLIAPLHVLAVEADE